MMRQSRNGRHAITSGSTRRVTSALLLRWIAELERHLPLAIGGADVSVHRARVASRRLREALPVLLPPSKLRRKALRGVRRVTRALGSVREMDVTIGILDELAHRPDIPRDALEDVRAHVVAERDRRQQRMLNRLRKVKLAKLHRRLASVAGALEAAGPYDWRGTLRERIARRARRLESAIEAAGRVYAPEGLHQVRIAGKKLRYTLEVAMQARLPAARRPVAVLKRTQELLGRLHDLQIIQHHIAAVMADPPARYAGSDGALSAIALVLEKECRHLHARYTSRLAALRDIVAECRAGLVPSLPRPGAARPLKMLRPRAPRLAAAKPA